MIKQLLVRKMVLSTFCFVTILFFHGCRNQGSENKDPGEKDTNSAWEALFDGQDVSHWCSEKGDVFPESGWSVSGNSLIVNGASEADSISAGNLFTKQKYGDFEFYFEWKMITVGGNSGIKYYVPGEGDSWDQYGPGPEYQILDDANHPWMLEGRMKPNDCFTMGSAYELYAADSSKNPAPLGEWNTSRIVSKQGQVEHWLNGDKIVSYDRFSDDFGLRVANSKFKIYPEYGRLKEGHIMLQDHGSEVHFRNIKIRKLLL